MKPPPFDYRRPTTVDEALGLLAELGDEAKVIAGGQSLAPMLNMRLARPEVLIDIGRLPGLRYIRCGSEGLQIGALTRHDQLEHYPTALPGFDVLRQTAPLVGHHPIRTRGTVGGSIAHADGAAEWCILAVLLDAQILVRSVRGHRAIAASDFFQGLFDTALDDDELIVEVRFPQPRDHAALEEYSRRHGDFAVVAASVAWDEQDGVIAEPRIVLGGVGSTPQRCPAGEAELVGQAAEPATFARAGKAVAEEIDPPGDLHATPEVRRRMAAALVERAAIRALGRDDKVAS